MKLRLISGLSYKMSNMNELNNINEIKTESHNTVERILNQTGWTLPELNQILYPQSEHKFGSRSGFIKPKMNLPEVLENQARRLAELGFDKRQLSTPLSKVITKFNELPSLQSFTYNGQKFDLDVLASFGIQPSPFDNYKDGSIYASNAVVSRYTFTLTDINGDELVFSELTPHLIQNYKFFIEVGEYATPPEKIVSFFNLKPETESRSNL